MLSTPGNKIARLLIRRIREEVNIATMRAFVRLRRMLSDHRELAQKFIELEQRVGGHDIEIRQIFEAIKKMMEPKAKPIKRIGFRVD